MVGGLVEQWLAQLPHGKKVLHGFKSTIWPWPFYLEFVFCAGSLFQSKEMKVVGSG